MHFEVLAEDPSGSIALGHILGKILGANYTEHSWRMHPYKGKGRLPNNLYEAPNPKNQQLLNNLPSLLRGLGRSLDESTSVVVVVVDLDDDDCQRFKQDLLDVLNACNPRPRTLFRIAIEESESWLLGDRAAVKAAYPNARDAVLNGYVQDSICGTWEALADAVHQGGAAKLKELGFPADGEAKCEWARSIAPRMDVDRNQSKSFQVFRDGVRNLAGIQP